jgi:hypothetical protein
MRDLIALTVVASLVGSMAMGCKKKSDDEKPQPEATTPAPAPSAKLPPHVKAPAPPGAPAPAASGAAPVLGDKVEIPAAHAVFNVPGGWKRSTTANGWTLFKAPDNHARLGYVSFTQPGESTSRLGQLAEAFDLTNLTWGGPTDGVIGKDHFPDHEGDTTTCTMKSGDPCTMRYMTINPGGSVQLMVVYLVNTAKGEHQRSHAMASINSLRRM